MTDRTQTVIIVDEDIHVRRFLSGALREQGYATLEFSHVDALIRCGDISPPACLIADLRSNVDNIEEQIGRLKLGCPAPLLAVVGQHDVRSAVAAMKAGAFEVLEKPFTVAAVLAIVGAAVGSAEYEQRTGREGAKMRLARLTSRELDVLRGLQAGKINKTIGLELGISPRTVEVYRSHIMTKTRVDTLADLLRLASLAGAAVRSELAEAGA
jgi:two-component system response regulator FixJ